MDTYRINEFFSHVRRLSSIEKGIHWMYCMDLRRFGGRGGAECAADLGLDASFPCDEVHSAGDLEAEGVVLGMENGVEVRKRERV